MALEAYTLAFEILPCFCWALIVITRFYQSIHSSTSFSHTTVYKLQFILEGVFAGCLVLERKLLLMEWRIWSLYSLFLELDLA